jgi:hypothetical protein
MARQILGFHAGLRGQALDHQGHRLRGGAAAGQMPMPVDTPKPRSLDGECPTSSDITT